VRLLLFLTLLLLSPVSQALENWRFSGFGSLGLTKINRDDLSFGAADNNWDFDNDTSLGLQLQGNLTNTVSFTTQVSTNGPELDGREAYKPELQCCF